MTSSDPSPGEAVKAVRFCEESLIVNLTDGRTISAPLVWFPRLLNATSSPRDNWRKSGGGFGIHWPDLDEDLSIAGLMAGVDARSA